MIERGRPVRTRPPLNLTQTMVTCWCDTSIVLIDWARVGESTDSCGRPGCQPPKQEESA